MINRNRNKQTIHFNQFKYITNILKRFNMENSKPLHIPLDSNRSKLIKNQSP